MYYIYWRYAVLTDKARSASRPSRFMLYDVRIGAMTCHQGNLSMQDAAVADRELDRAHGTQNRASSPPLESRSQRG